MIVRRASDVVEDAADAAAAKLPPILLPALRKGAGPQTTPPTARSRLHPAAVLLQAELKEMHRADAAAAAVAAAKVVPTDKLDQGTADRDTAAISRRSAITSRLAANMSAANRR